MFTMIVEVEPPTVTMIVPVIRPGAVAVAGAKLNGVFMDQDAVAPVGRSA
jgi:hypothetical protein